MKNLAAAKEQTDASALEATKLKVQVQELQDQVRGVMFFLQAKEKTETGDGVAGEAAGGTLEVPQATNSRSTLSRRKNGERWSLRLPLGSVAPM